MGQTETNKIPYPTPTVETKAKISYAGSERQSSLPKGLVGHKCTANVTVSGVSCNSLLDPGSQVTVVSWSFYKDHLSHQPIKSMSHLLEVDGANGLSIPYLGYVELNIAFPKEFIKSEPEIYTLALVILDICSSSNIPVLIGTNTLDLLYDEHCGHTTLNIISPLHGYTQILKMLAFRKKQCTSGRIGMLRMKGKKEVIPAGWKVPLEGYVSMNNIIERYAMIEQPVISSLPGGIFVDTCLITLPL